MIDKGHLEVTNRTGVTYFGRVMAWVTEDRLECGRGVLGQDSPIGRIGPGETVAWADGSTRERPVTVEIWDHPCGEGCEGTPIGVYLVPISSVEPPVPGST